MTVELMIGIVIAVSALILAAWTARQQRQQHHAPETREAQLQRQVEELNATVRTLLMTDRERQKRIEILETDLAVTRLDLAKAQGEIVRLQERLAIYESGAGAKKATPRALLVALGNDPELQVDLAALRGAGLRITRLQPVTYDSLKSTLERARRQGKPIELVHMAVHAGPSGVQLDRIVSRLELSELLRNVTVLVVMGCFSSDLADFLPVVPTVVAFREAVPHSEAWQFALLFWSAIADGLTPEAAFDLAVERGPSAIGEYAELFLN